ncbi:GAF domain-containing protein [Flocculibacter collagenilyticus]|uniref:GAF domain-containing protein n=1 Tax=Flocculibacter collagenilyticus TaxID=2744479 RepID=UPI0018F4DDDA|nr:GAF domain-containing protein [Flocculibacter collagenilyticus]
MNSSKHETYSLLAKQVEALTSGEPNLIANLANVSALIFEALEDVNWAGFYLKDSESELVLGPFQGKPACVRIPVGKGVCGTAFSEDKTLLVEDVHQFAGHIACDSASNSEIVLPLHKNGELIGVLDIDSPLLSRFDHEDQSGLEEVITVLERMLQ